DVLLGRHCHSQPIRSHPAHRRRTRNLATGGFCRGQRHPEPFFLTSLSTAVHHSRHGRVHVWALHVAGNNNPTGLDVKSPRDTIPFHPYYTAKDFLFLILFLTVFAYFVFYLPNFFGHPDNYQLADPFKTPPHIVPEWYFLTY